jgi:hypothetical protein
LVNIYLLQLQQYLFEAPIPSLLPALIAIGLTTRLTAFDRLLLSSGGLLLLVYFAYWHRGFFPGPRFLYPLTPIVVWWTVRLPSLVRARWGNGFAFRFTLASLGVSAAIALVSQVPLRAAGYARSAFTMRWDADTAAASAGVRNALVLVRESWGAELIARMWGLRVPRAFAEEAYHSIDGCVLETTLSDLSHRGVTGTPAAEEVRLLFRDSARLIASPFSTDGSERFLPGSTYTATCRARVEEERSGFTLYAPLMLAHEYGNVYARDLHALDTVLLRVFPRRPIFLLKAESDALGARLRYYPVRRDSLARDWGVPLDAVVPPAP